MNKVERILWIICTLEALIIGYLVFGGNTNTPQIEIQTKEVVRDSIIRDSIYIVNEVIKTEIKYAEKQYQQDSIDIMSASDSMLFESFTRYINDYNNK